MIFSNKIGILSKLAEKRLISGADENLAEFLCGLEKNLAPEEKQVLAAAAALLSEWVSSGSICLTKDDIATFTKTNKDALSGTDFPSWEEIKNVLSKSSCCTLSPENEQKPLVLADDRIYFYKYWLYEDSLAAKVLKLSKLPGKYAENAGGIKKFSTNFLKIRKAKVRKMRLKKSSRTDFPSSPAVPAQEKPRLLQK